VKILS
jgi:hypothetical protein